MPGFFACPPDAWGLARAALFAAVRGQKGGAPEPIAIADLRWWEDSVRMSAGKMSFPTIKVLSEVWGWRREKVLRLVNDPPRWADPAHLEESKALVQRVALRAPSWQREADLKRTRTGPEADQDRTCDDKANAEDFDEADLKRTRTGPEADQDRTTTRARVSPEHRSTDTGHGDTPAATPSGPPSAGAEVVDLGRRVVSSERSPDESVEITTGRGQESGRSPTTPTATAAPSPGVDRPSPPPAPRGPSGEGATGPQQAHLWARGGAGARGGMEAGGAGSEPAKGPPRARKPPPPPVDLTSPDDPSLLLLGAKVRLEQLTEPIVEVYRAWWRRQPSPATCKLTAGRLQLLRLALETYTAAELCHLIRYAYEAADLGNHQRAWRGDAGNLPPDLEMLLRGSNLARNVEMAARWSIEPVSRAPPDEAPSGWRPPPPPSVTPTRGGQPSRFDIVKKLAQEHYYAQSESGL